jgi:hypothetical protein
MARGKKAVATTEKPPAPIETLPDTIEMLPDTIEILPDTIAIPSAAIDKPPAVGPSSDKPQSAGPPSYLHQLVLVQRLAINANKKEATLYLKLPDNSKIKAKAVDQAFHDLQGQVCPLSILITKTEESPESSVVISDVEVKSVAKTSPPRSLKRERDEDISLLPDGKKEKIDSVSLLEKNVLSFKDIVFPKTVGFSPTRPLTRSLKFLYLGASQVKFTATSQAPYQNVRFLDVSVPQDSIQGNSEICCSVFDVSILLPLVKGQVYFLTEGVVPKIFGAEQKKTLNFKKGVKFTLAESGPISLNTLDEVLLCNVPARVNVMGVVLRWKTYPIQVLKVGSMSHQCIDLVLKDDFEYKNKINNSPYPISIYNVSLYVHGGITCLGADSYSFLREDPKLTQVLSDWIPEGVSKSNFLYQTSNKASFFQEAKKQVGNSVNQMAYVEIKSTLVEVSLLSVGFLCKCQKWNSPHHLLEDSSLLDCPTCGVVPYCDLVCTSSFLGTFEDELDKAFEARIYSSEWDLLSEMSVERWKKEEEHPIMVLLSNSNFLYAKTILVLRIEKEYAVVHSATPAE